VGKVRTARSRATATAALAAVLVLAACSSSGPEAETAPTAATPATCPAVPADGAADGTAAERVLTATQAFVATLDDAQRISVTAERDPANLAQWSNLPDELFERAGLRMDGLSADQQGAALAILQAALSPEGYAQVTQITAADGVLAAEEGGPDLDFGADHYWIRILGTPAPTGEWTVQYGGHHLAVNITIDGSEMTLAPTLWGAQPASYESAGTTSEPLCGETTKAFALVNALDATQQQAAILATPVKEIVLGAGQDGKTLAPEGISGSTLTDEQKTLLLDLVDEWIRPLNPDAAAAKLAAAEQNLDQTTFAWSGSTTIGQPIYYRVQGPTFTIEFAHQQGQGANAGGVTHIHSIYREPGNDYGAQLGS
jgi:Protein of unknown function (DUF3500)